MSEDCPKCEESRQLGANFCSGCGRFLGPEPVPEKPKAGVLELILIVTAIFIAILIIIEAIIMVVNTSDVYSFLVGKGYSLFVIVPYPQTIFSIYDALPAYWVLLVLIIVVCVIAAVYEFMVKTKNFKEVSTQGVVENTAFFWIAVSFCASTLITTVIVLITISTGTDISTPDFGSQLGQFFSFANAAVWEEIVSRLVYIGLPMLIITRLVYKKKGGFDCLIGGFGMSKVAIVFIVISAIIFGLAHYPGWEGQSWKVIEVAISGLFFGYVFVRFGLYASILLHFVNDYLSTIAFYSTGFEVVVFLLIVGLGAFALAYVLLRLWKSKESIISLPLFKNDYFKNT